MPPARKFRRLAGPPSAIKGDSRRSLHEQYPVTQTATAHPNQPNAVIHVDKTQATAHPREQYPVDQTLATAHPHLHNPVIDVDKTLAAAHLREQYPVTETATAHPREPNNSQATALPREQYPVDKTLATALLREPNPVIDVDKTELMPIDCDMKYDFYGHHLEGVPLMQSDLEYWSDDNLKPWVYWPPQSNQWLIATRLQLTPDSVEHSDRASHARPAEHLNEAKAKERRDRGLPRKLAAAGRAVHDPYGGIMEA